MEKVSDKITALQEKFSWLEGFIAEIVQKEIPPRQWLYENGFFRIKLNWTRFDHVTPLAQAFPGFGLIEIYMRKVDRHPKSRSRESAEELLKDIIVHEINEYFGVVDTPHVAWRENKEAQRVKEFLNSKGIYRSETINGVLNSKSTKESNGR